MSIKKINIFIGSSIEELKPERDELMRFIQGLNNKYVDRGYFFHGYVCEETPNMMREGGSQALHDEFIRDKADAAIFLFFHRAGEFTMHELRLARETFLAGKKPNVFVFFKAVDNAPDTCEEIRRCVDVVFNDFGHYYKMFADVDTVKLELLQFITDALPFGELVIKDGDASAPAVGTDKIALGSVSCFGCFGCLGGRCRLVGFSASCEGERKNSDEQKGDEFADLFHSFASFHSIFYIQLCFHPMSCL